MHDKYNRVFYRTVIQLQDEFFRVVVEVPLVERRMVHRVEELTDLAQV